MTSKKHGRPRNTVDMAIMPAETVGYELPDPEECEEYPDRIVLGEGHELYVRFRIWKDRLIVEFAIGQIVRHNGRWVEVARVDTCHGSVHKHQLRKTRPTDSVGAREQIVEIPETNGWALVDSWYDKALDLMKDSWKDNLRRWRRDSA